MSVEVSDGFALLRSVDAFYLDPPVQPASPSRRTPGGKSGAVTRCPRCGIARPRLSKSRDSNSRGKYWAMYACSVCHNIILAQAPQKPRSARWFADAVCIWCGRDAENAKRGLAFALALAELLFVLPARVTRGIEETKT